MAEVQNDRAFVQFKSLEYGWRAAFYLLTRTYYHKYRLYTIRSIISRWAPRCLQWYGRLLPQACEINRNLFSYFDNNLYICSKIG